MPQITIAPLIIGSVLAVGGALIVIFRRRVLKWAPVSVANFSLRGDRVVPNTIVGVTIWGIVLFAVGIIIVLRAGLQLF